MSLKNFWQYLIDHGWRLPNFEEDEDGNYSCPFCNYTITNKVELDKVPEYTNIIYCPRCGEIEAEDVA